MNDETLRNYLQNHWVAATAGTAVFRRVGRTHGDPVAAAAISSLAEEVAADQDSLRRIMDAVGAQPARAGTVAGRLSATLGRIKPNGSLLRRTALTDVLELEGLRTAVTAKRAGWELLLALTAHDDRLDEALLHDLHHRADRQVAVLGRLHLSASRWLLEAPDKQDAP